MNKFLSFLKQNRKKILSGMCYIATFVTIIIILTERSENMKDFVFLLLALLLHLVAGMAMTIVDIRKKRVWYGLVLGFAGMTILWVLQVPFMLYLLVIPCTAGIAVMSRSVIITFLLASIFLVIAALGSIVDALDQYEKQRPEYIEQHRPETVVVEDINSKCIYLKDKGLYELDIPFSDENRIRHGDSLKVVIRGKDVIHVEFCDPRLNRK